MKGKMKKASTPKVSKTIKRKRYIIKPYWLSVGGKYWIVEEIDQ